MSDSTIDTLMATAPGLEHHRKSTAIAYVFWFCTGIFGGHRFYAGQTGSATLMLLLTLFGIPLSFVGIGFFMLFIVGIWTLIDLFRIGGMIEDYNLNLLLQHHLRRNYGLKAAG